MTKGAALAGENGIAGSSVGTRPLLPHAGIFTTLMILWEIGALILTYTRNLDIASAFACIFTLTVIGFLIFKSMETLNGRIAFCNHEDGLTRVSHRRSIRWIQQRARA